MGNVCIFQITFSFTFYIDASRKSERKTTHSLVCSECSYQNIKSNLIYDHSRHLATHKLFNSFEKHKQQVKI